MTDQNGAGIVAIRLPKARIEEERKDKLKRRGGFQHGYMLTRTPPHFASK